MTALADDLAHLRQALAPIQRAADRLPWAKQRPWRAETHVWWESDLLVVDLHDLGRKQAAAAVRATLDAAADLQTGAVCFVTGRGKRSIGPGVLRQAVLDELIAHVPDGQVRPRGPGRLVAIWDEERAPNAATGALGWGFWLLMAGFAVAAVLALLRMAGVL